MQNYTWGGSFFCFFSLEEESHDTSLLHAKAAKGLFGLTNIYWGFTILGLGRLWLLHCFPVPEEFDSSVSLSYPGAWVAYDKFDHFNGFKDSTKLATNFSR